MLHPFVEQKAWFALMLFVVLKSKSMVCFELLIELRVWFELHPFVEQKAWFVLMLLTS